MKILLGDTRSKAHLRFMGEQGWGRMFASVRATPGEWEPWGFDNGAYGAWKRGEEFAEGIFLRRLEEARKVHSDPVVAVCPDIVAGGMGSLEFSVKWLGKWNLHPVCESGYPGNVMRGLQSGNESEVARTETYLTVTALLE